MKTLKAKQILDSRGKPTIKVFLKTNSGLFEAAVPSGTSTGKNEALELRDKNGEVKKAISNIDKIIWPVLKKENNFEQERIDKILIELDGTKNKSRLGANAILAVSMAICRANAASKNFPLFKYISKLAEVRPPLILPRPCFNIIEGGKHVKKGLDIQEFMIVPQMKTFRENLQSGKNIFRKLKNLLEKESGKPRLKIGQEGGFAPNIPKNSGAIRFILLAAENVGYKNKVKIGLDCAANHFFKKGKYFLEQKFLSKQQLLNFYENLAAKYNLLFLEDPYSEEDFEGFKKITQKIGGKTIIIGDDLLCTNPEMIKLAQKKKLCNGMILKINQIGTITEAIAAAKLAKSFGWKIMVSHRAGETMDDFIADLAVGIGADFIKSGAPFQPERMAKYNRLLKIEKEI